MAKLKRERAVMRASLRREKGAATVGVGGASMLEYWLDIRMRKEWRVVLCRGLCSSW